MVDREKVLKGLEELRMVYHSEQILHPKDFVNQHDMELIEDALALLKAQEPEETRLVRHFSRPNVYADLWLHCEKCGGRVDDRYKPKFCPECGRTVKWE